MSIDKLTNVDTKGINVANERLEANKVNEIIDAVNTNTSTNSTNTTNIATNAADIAAIEAFQDANVTAPKTVEVEITNANIIAMNGTPVDVVAAPGAGKALEFVSAVLIYDYDTAAYTDGGAVSINYGSGGAAISTTIAAANSFAATGDKVFQMSRLNAAGGYTMPVNTSLAITNDTAAFVDPGTAAGVGRLQITYREHTTGL